MNDPIYTITKADVKQMIANMETGTVTPGRCQYSAPCVLGSIMPEDVIKQIVSMGKDGISFDALVDDNIIACAPEIEVRDLESAQNNFDAGGEEAVEYVIASLKKAIND